MKWIRKRIDYITEAKIGDVILPSQLQAVKDNWGQVWLDLEEIIPTDNIKQGKWKISDEDKNEVFSKFFFDANINKIYTYFSNMTDKFSDIIKLSINIEGQSDIIVKAFETFDVKKPTMTQLTLMNSNIFKKIAISESTADEIMIKDESGRPVMGEDGRPMKRPREEGEVIFTRNLVSISTFITDYNRLFPSESIAEFTSISDDMSNIYSAARDLANSDYVVDYNPYDKDMYLSILHNPKDILNMSISKYYTSCQHLYSGGYRHQVLGNVFDPNSIPAFIIFDTPIIKKGRSGDQVISEQLPLCRLVVRNIETFGKEPKPIIFYDRAYPDRMRDIMSKLIDKYSGMEGTVHNDKKYIFAPDIDQAKNIQTPYMDRLGVEIATYIGVNTKHLLLSNIYDWSRTIVSPNSRLEEVIVETTHLPENFLKLNLKLNWIKFRNLIIMNFSVFSNIKTDSYSFDKCKFDGKIFEQIKAITPDIKKLQISACLIDNMDLSIFGELDELHLIYTLDANQLEPALTGLTIKKLVISGDIYNQNRAYLNSIKQRGVNIQVVGPRM